MLQPAGIHSPISPNYEVAWMCQWRLQMLRRSPHVARGLFPPPPSRIHTQTHVVTCASTGGCGCCKDESSGLRTSSTSWRLPLQQLTCAAACAALQLPRTAAWPAHGTHYNSYHHNLDGCLNVSTRCTAHDEATAIHSTSHTPGAAASLLVRHPQLPLAAPAPICMTHTHPWRQSRSPKSQGCG